MKKKIAILLSLALILSEFCFTATSCSGNAVYSEGEGDLQVLCTVFAPFDFAREIGGERVTVSILQDSGADLHNYTPTAATLEALSSADLFIYVGGVSDEAWIEGALRRQATKTLSPFVLWIISRRYMPSLKMIGNPTEMVIATTMTRLKKNLTVTHTTTTDITTEQTSISGHR